VSLAIAASGEAMRLSMGVEARTQFTPVGDSGGRYRQLQIEVPGENSALAPSAC
jgi:hypothetical protein